MKYKLKIKSVNHWLDFDDDFRFFQFEIKGVGNKKEIFEAFENLKKEIEKL